MTTNQLIAVLAGAMAVTLIVTLLGMLLIMKAADVRWVGQHTERAERAASPHEVAKPLKVYGE